VKTWSGGMSRRLDLAMGLIHRPQVLFLDEPTTGLDPEVRARLWEEIRRLAHEEGLTILLTTHYLEEADELAARLAIVDAGRAVPFVLAALESAGARVASVTVARPSLDDVYLRHTGHAYAEGTVR